MGFLTGAQSARVRNCQAAAVLRRDCIDFYSLDEHWNGTDKPHQVAADAIPIYARIALLAQVVDER